MDDELEKIFKKGQQIRLNTSEKEKMRDFIVSYTKRNKRHQKLNIFTILTTVPAILSFIIIFGGIGVSFAAEHALPGDILYPMKIRVNEEARGLLAVSDESKVRWLATVAERRIAETETLAKENRLNSETQAKIERNFNDKTKKIEEKLQLIGDKNNSVAAEEVSRNLENTLERHEEVLKKLFDEKSDSREEINSVLKNMKTFQTSIRKSREGSERKRGLLIEIQLSATSSSAASIEVNNDGGEGSSDDADNKRGQD